MQVKVYKTIILIFFFISNLRVSAQTFYATFEQSAGYNTAGEVPFWFRAGRWGNIPSEKLSIGISGMVGKDYSPFNKIDWGAGLQTRLNVGHDFGVKLIQAYAKLKLGFLEIKGGRISQLMGLCDTILSSGSFSVSGNAPGIPGLQIGIPEYRNISFLGNIIALKFNYSHGCLGEIPTNLNGQRGIEKTWFHQKSIYGRLGKPSWNLKLYGGFNHQVFWGNEDDIFGSNFTLSKAQTYFYVITGKGYATSNIEPSRIGNHLGSFDLGLEYDFGSWRLFLYRQNFYDFIAFRYLANISDGLNGVSVTFRTKEDRFFKINRFLAEFLYTRNQGKRYSLRDPTYYNENYYNNYIYSDGWSYKGFALGNPLLTSKIHMRDGLSDEAYDYFHNNLVSAIHLGVEGEAGKWVYTIKSTYSLNYGTHFTKFKKGIDQFSFFAEGRRNFREGNGIGFRTAFDRGGLLYNSAGFFFFLYQTF